MKTKHIPKYIVVFDMDETLGHFEQLSIFWMVLTKYYRKYLKKKLSTEYLYNLIDIYFNKILRPKILHIIKYCVGILFEIEGMQDNRRRSCLILIQASAFPLHFPLAN